VNFLRTDIGEGFPDTVKVDNQMENGPFDSLDEVSKIGWELVSQSGVGEGVENILILEKVGNIGSRGKWGAQVVGCQQARQSLGRQMLQGTWHAASAEWCGACQEELVENQA